MRVDLSSKGPPMASIPRSIVVSTALAATVSLAVAGCQSGDSSEAGDSRAVVAQGVNPTTMDPLQHRETTTGNVLQHLYDPLIERNGKDPRKFDAALATKWERTNDTTVRFTLRKGVKFSDGSTFEAADVVYTVNYLLGKLPDLDPAILSYQYGSVKNAKEVDEHTVDIVTTTTDPLLLDRIAGMMIVPEGAVDDDPKALASKPVGTGPYTLTKWDRNNEVVMKAKKNYFLGKPRIKDVVFKTMTEASSRLSALEAGQVDLISAVPADNVPEVEASGQAKVQTVNSARIASVWLNTLESGPLKKPEVRVALNHAVNVDSIIKHVMSGHGTRVATVVPPYFTNYDPSVKPIPHDPAKAKQLLADAGYPNGFSMEMMVPQGRYEFAAEVTQALAGQLKKVGVRVKVNTVDFGVFAKTTQERDIEESFYGAWGEEYFNPVDEFQVAVKSGTKGFSWYDNPRADDLIDRSSTTLDATEQKKLVTQTQRLMLEDPPFIFLFAYKDLYGVANRLDWKPRSDESIDMYEASIAS